MSIECPCPSQLAAHVQERKDFPMVKISPTNGITDLVSQSEAFRNSPFLPLWCVSEHLAGLQPILSIVTFLSGLVRYRLLASHIKYSKRTDLDDETQYLVE